MGVADYGNSYWCVGVPKGVSKDGVILLHAESVSVDPTGALIAMSSVNERRTEAFPNLVLAAGAWTYFYAASIWDGAPVAVCHWSGVVNDDGRK